jgi:hypothetical protein
MEVSGHVPHRGPWEVGWDPGTQCWYDWGDECDVALMDQTWYGLALETVAQFAEACGDVATVVECRDRLSRGKAFLQGWWDAAEGAYRSPGFSRGADPRGNALAVLAGMTASPIPESLLRCLAERETNSIYMEKHVVDALCHAGRADLAFSRTQRRYGPDLQSGCSTLPEAFGEDGNHAWGVGPAAALVREIAGLRPQVPGWRTFVLRPADVSVATCSARVHTPAGNISVSIQRHPDSWHIKAECPEDAQGTLELPGRFSRIDFDGQGARGEILDGIRRISLPKGSSEITARV